MPTLSKFRRRSGSTVVAVQLNLDTEGFTYRKWGGRQTCKPGDWLVDNGGDIYSVDRGTFEKTYERISPGVYRKSSAVWARVAEEAGSIRTKEGETHYARGDYLVFNEAQGGDGYAIGPEKFRELYEPDG